ncbi:MAG: FliM/FliN family flagellar motor switch protein [Parvularculaceae bacterium]|nr:FliM/FliN family flagellar motor switch protein [Parvularculaceae bacterium]
MPNATMSALIRKREAPKPAPGAEFAPLLKALGKTGETVFGDLLQGDVEVKIRAAGSRRLISLLADASDPGVYCWLTDETAAPTLLVRPSNAFAALLMERLLGGPLAAPAVDAPYSQLAFDMAGSFIDVMTPALNAALAKIAPEAGEEAVGGRRMLTSPAVAMAEIEDLEAVAFAFDVEVGGGALANAVQLYFARGFLERIGVGGEETGETPPEWSDGLKRNLLTAEIPLRAVADRLSSTVGDLSRLEVGQVVALSADALADVELVASTNKGPTLVARARLGGLNGRKAVKLTTPVDPEFIAGL